VRPSLPKPGQLGRAQTSTPRKRRCLQRAAKRQMLRVDSKESVASGYYHACTKSLSPTMSPVPSFTSHFRQRVHRGFTLIELMVVLVIVGILAALIVPNVLDRADDARTTAAKTDINNIVQALKLYRLDNQRYPSSEQGLQALVSKPTSGAIPSNWKPYLDKLPNDPWGRPYQYLNPGIKGEIDIMSFGADGQAGGEGKNADVGSWQ
jgi:general secretion pathway protein G